MTDLKEEEEEKWLQVRQRKEEMLKGKYNSKLNKRGQA